MIIIIIIVITIILIITLIIININNDRYNEEINILLYMLSIKWNL